MLCCIVCKVCCKCCDLLDRHSSKPLLKVRSLNPLLYTYVQDLVTIEVSYVNTQGTASHKSDSLLEMSLYHYIQTLRKDLLVMKTYFMRCSKAKESQLLKRLDCFPHFKDGAKRFSLVDLKTVHSGELLKELTVIHREFAVHIKKDCTVSRGENHVVFLDFTSLMHNQVCLGRGFLCEFCNSGEVLYPFDRQCRQCPKCHIIFHRLASLKLISAKAMEIYCRFVFFRHCYSEMTTCPKCSRTRHHRQQT